MTCGVPQGSVLGPTLWNVGYDSVVRASLPAGCTTLYYVDDTLLMVTGATFEEAKTRAELGAMYIISLIERLGLRVSVPKTEVVVFGAGGAPESE